MAERNGFLTATDREFLRDEKKYESKQGRYERRQSIRERTRQAFDDFSLLYTELSEDERKKIFDIISSGTYHRYIREDFDREPPEEISDAQSFRSGLFSTLAFMYLGLWGTPVSFNQLVEAAVFQSERDHLDRIVNTELKIEEQEPIGAVESAISKLETETGTVDSLDHVETRMLLEFIADPSGFSPVSAREQALERLNNLEQFSLSLEG